jgi:hypothetical protein
MEEARTKGSGWEREMWIGEREGVRKKGGG